MARADLLVALVRAGAGGDETSFRRAAEALIAEEHGKKHGVLAGQLEQALGSGRAVRPLLPNARRDEGAGLLHERLPERRLHELVLHWSARRVAEEVIEEHHRRDLLRSHGLEPRHRVLLTGPPGGGKTTLAEALATELAVPLLLVRYEGLIGSFLGETAARLDALFETARLRACVLFFDEFDAVAKERGDTHETGEIKRVVSSLLLQVDRLPSHVIVVAATNHPELLDRAVWRRMQVRIDLPTPDLSGRAEWFARWFDRMGWGPELPIGYLIKQLDGLSYAELEEFSLDVQRRLVLAGETKHPSKLIHSVVESWSSKTSATSHD